MGNNLMAHDNSLLGSALSIATRKAQTLESLSAALNAPEQDLSLYWVMVNGLRRFQGHALPVPLDAHVAGEKFRSQHGSNQWYAPTWQLAQSLEEFKLNESLAVHYERILTEPEGGHYELNLAAGEVVYAMQFEHAPVDATQMMRICVQASEPKSGVELLVSNAGKMLISIEKLRSEPITASFIESLYAKLVEGISIKEVSEDAGEEPSVKGSARARSLESFCAHLWPREHRDVVIANDADLGEASSNDTLINALIALHFFKTFHLFPAGNSVFAYLMYFLILHRAGYHFSAHVPVVELLYRHNDDGEQDVGAAGHRVDAGSGRGHHLPCAPDDLAVECDGYYDWTRFFEQAVACIIDEQRWIMTKFDGMSRRRERLRAIIDTDETMNYRQKEVLLETVLHSNAEFTYAIHEQRYDVSYPCARSDYARLMDVGFLQQHDDGIRHFFVASDTFTQVFFEYLQTHCTEAFSCYYREDGALRDEYKSSEDAASEYNKDIGFYEKSLLDKTYVEHYDFRRACIADSDGPHRRSRLRE